MGGQKLSQLISGANLDPIFVGWQVTSEVEAHLSEAGVQCKSYQALLSDVRLLAASGTR